MNLAEIKDLHAWYLDKLRLSLGEKYIGDMSVRPQAAYCLWSILEKRKPQLMLELGTGFTTLITHKWAIQTGSEIISADHSKKWLRIMKTMLEDQKIDRARLVEIGWLKEKSLRMSSPRFDFCFVDHGPSWGDRYGDLPWIMSLLSDDSTLILDDWWPIVSKRPMFYRSVKMATGILRRMGYHASPIEESRANMFDKALAIVSKSAGRPPLSR